MNVLMDLPTEILHEHFLPKLSTENLRKLSLTNKRMQEEVSSYLNRIHRIIIAKHPDLAEVGKYHLIEMLSDLLGDAFGDKLLKLIKDHKIEIREDSSSFNLRLGPYAYIRESQGETRSEEWRFNEVLHRTEGPASLQYNENGTKKAEGWYLNGYLHRQEGPAITNWFEDGKVKSEKWYLHGKYSRAEGPAIIEYHRNGRKRMEKRFICKREQLVEYYENGQKSLEEWTLDDEYHSMRGPARIEYHENGQKRLEEWQQAGYYYREDGHARIEYDENGQVESADYGFDD